MAEYELVGRTRRSMAEYAEDCGQGDYPIRVGADLVTAELSFRLAHSSESQHAEVKYISFPNLDIPHGCSCRVGGVSEGAYSSLNIGLTSADVPGLVHENRLRLGAAVGVQPLPILNMTHGTRVVRLDEVPKTLRQGDACITDVPGLPLNITTADCVPIIIYDPRHRALGLAHAGWRGTLARIGMVTLEAMRENYGTRPEDVQIGIGPAIGPCCFEVGWDVAELFLKEFPSGKLLKDFVSLLQNPQGFVHKKENCAKCCVNLWRANLLSLLEAGVGASQVCSCGLCTMCWRDLFYSYRRDRQVTGRIATLAMVPHS